MVNAIEKVSLPQQKRADLLAKKINVQKKKKNKKKKKQIRQFKYHTGRTSRKTLTTHGGKIHIKKKTRLQTKKHRLQPQQ